MPSEQIKRVDVKEGVLAIPAIGMFIFSRGGPRCVVTVVQSSATARERAHYVRNEEVR